MWWPGIEHHRLGGRPPRDPPRVNDNVGFSVRREPNTRIKIVDSYVKVDRLVLCR